MAKILLYIHGRENPALPQTELMKHGHEVRVSIDGRDVFGQLHVFKPDVVVVVCDTPRVDEMEYCVYLRKQGVNIPVIFVPAENDGPGVDPDCYFDPEIIKSLETPGSL
jgi:DNA-binding response OmpR family regulator